MDWKNVYHVKDFKCYPTSKIVIKNKYKKYSADFICLDTETSRYEDKDGWIYQFCFSYQDNVYYGRQIEDFIKCLKIIENSLIDETVVIYIHNASYDVQFLKDFIFDEWGKENVTFLALQPHKILTLSFGSFEIRCSYLLSGKSLEKWGNDLNIKNKKLSGLIDYNVARYPNTPLNKKDWLYQIRDVIALNECITKQMLMFFDDVASIPLTKTAYVRRDCRRSFRKNFKKNNTFFQLTRLSKESYLLCRDSFSGGLTHCNRHFINQTINENIKHRDFVSHYPTQMLEKYYPIGKFIKVGINLKIEDIEKYKIDYCLLLNITFENVRLKNKKITCPYMQTYKAIRGGALSKNIIDDNGRILECSGAFSLTLTELDLDIILRQYNFDFLIINVGYAALKGKCPTYILDNVKKYFYDKCLLKNIDMLNYNLSKEKLNSCYGMCATDPIRECYAESSFYSGEWKKQKISDIDDMLNDYYDNKNNVMPYQIGVWVTAHARYELINLIENYVGYEKFLYCDTDSIFYISDDTIEQKINELNDKWKENAYYVKINDKKFFVHQFEDENETIKQFRMLHSKCYAYVVEYLENGKIAQELKTTIAGVNAKYRSKELGVIDNLKPDFTFVKSGGTRSKYLERERGDSHSACLILPTSKKLKNVIDEKAALYWEE